MDNQLLYSKDYGASWGKLKLLHTKDISVSHIYMTNSKNGVAASHNNDIILTEDNFKSCTSIPSPRDQGLTSSPRIEKILIYKDYTILKNFDHTYYTHKERVSWKRMENPDYLDFGVDKETNELYLVSTDWQVYKSSDNLKKFEKVNGRLPTKPADIKTTNGTIYVLDEFFYLYGIKDKTDRRFPLTSAHKIRNFSSIDIHTNNWIATSKKAIYESVDWGASWKRISGDYFTQNSIRDNKRNAIAANPQIDGQEYSKIIGTDSNLFLIFARQQAGKLQQTPSNCIIFTKSGFKEIKTFEGLYVSEIYERPSYYLASAHNDLDSYVFTSIDLVNWKQLLKWENCLITSVFINGSNNAYVLNSSGELKYIEQLMETFPHVTNLLTSADSAKIYPNDCFSDAFYFISKQEGYAYSSGASSHSGKGFKTNDGGKIWTVTNSSFPQYNQYYELDDLYYYSDDSHLYIRNSKSEINSIAVRDYVKDKVQIEGFSVNRNHNIFVKLIFQDNYRKNEFLLYSKIENK